jgi:hypothetical protein
MKGMKDMKATDLRAVDSFLVTQPSWIFMPFMVRIAIAFG